MKTYITTDKAIEDLGKPGCIIPSTLLELFPNYFGINLCSVKGFEVDMTDDDQYKSIRIDFLPTYKFTIEVKTDSDRKDIKELCLHALSHELDKLGCYYNVGTKTSEN